MLTVVWLATGFSSWAQFDHTKTCRVISWLLFLIGYVFIVRNQLKVMRKNQAMVTNNPGLIHSLLKIYINLIIQFIHDFVLLFL